MGAVANGPKPRARPAGERSKREAAEARLSGGRRWRNAERTRAELLEVATDEFSEKGYAGARVEEIVQRCGVTKAVLYHYFESKEQLFVAVMGAARGFTVKEQPADGQVGVTTRRELVEHLRALPEVLGMPSIERIYLVARHLSTWQPKTVGWADF